MAATMKVYFDWGGSDGSPGTAHNVTDNGQNKIRMKTSDDDVIDANNPIPVPDGDFTNNSFWKHVYLQCTDDAGLTQIDNVKFFTDGSGFGEGIVLNVGDGEQVKNSGSDAGYILAVGTTGETGSILTEHGNVSAISDAFDYTSANPRDVTISEEGNIIDSTDETTDYLVLQLAVSSSASSGTLTSETMTYRYDEI